MKLENKLELQINNLCDLLEGQINIYSHLWNLLNVEYQALVAADISELNELNQAKEKMITQIREMDQARVVLISEIEQANPNLGAIQNLSTLVNLVARDPLLFKLASRIKEAQSSLLLSVERVVELNKSNEALAESALENIRGALGSLVGNQNKNKVYKREGKLKGAQPNSGTIVSREA